MTPHNSLVDSLGEGLQTPKLWRFPCHNGSTLGAFYLVARDTCLMGNDVLTIWTNAFPIRTSTGSIYMSGFALLPEPSSCMALSHWSGSISFWHFMFLLFGCLRLVFSNSKFIDAFFHTIKDIIKVFRLLVEDFHLLFPYHERERRKSK